MEIIVKYKHKIYKKEVVLVIEDKIKEMESQLELLIKDGKHEESQLKAKEIDESIALILSGE